MSLSAAPVIEPDLPIIDSHHHLWLRPEGRYLLDEYAADLADGHKVLATVYVECGSMLRRDGPDHLRAVGEAEFASGVASMSASGLFGPTRVCAAFVGTADFTQGDTVDEALDALAQASGGRLRSIRGAAAWDADASVNPGGRPHAPRGLLRAPQFLAGFSRFAKRDLVYDAWQYFPQLGELCQLADDFAQVPFVINHCGGLLGIGPYQSPDNFKHWKAQVTEAARRPNTFMKLGGLSRRRCGFGFEDRSVPALESELAHAWHPYIETCVELFGPKRCMFESNFPADKVATGYRTLWNALKLSVAGYSRSEKEDLFHGTAAQVYRILA